MTETSAQEGLQSNPCGQLPDERLGARLGFCVTIPEGTSPERMREGRMEMATLEIERFARVRPQHIEDWLEDDPDQYLAPEERELVDEARAFVRSLEFEPLGAKALLWAHVRAEEAVAFAMEEGLRRTPFVAAMHKLMIAEGATAQVRGVVLERFLPRLAALRQRGG